MPIVRMRSLRGLGSNLRIKDLRDDLETLRKKIREVKGKTRRGPRFGRGGIRGRARRERLAKEAAEKKAEELRKLHVQESTLLARIAALEEITPSDVTLDWGTPAADTSPAPPLTTQDPANAYLPAPRKGPGTATLVGGGLVAAAVAAAFLLGD